MNAFLESKRELVASSPHLSDAARERALLRIDARRAQVADTQSGEEGDETGGEEEPGEPPVPGGIGMGVIYNDDFRADFGTGTAIEFYIACPRQPGGNVATWLYLTAMNRATDGVEAFISYYGQEDFHFKVFDWARDDQSHWQVDLPYDALAPYVAQVSIEGTEQSCVYVMNYTYEVESGTWANEAYLQNFDTGNADLIYRYSYVSTAGAQRSGAEGWWGPIVETFQASYTGTRPLGFAYTNVASQQNGVWGAWEHTTPENSWIREDGTGFKEIVFSPNFTMIVDS